MNVATIAVRTVAYILGCVNLGITLVVLKAYMTLWLRIRRSGDKQSGILPQHVWMIAIGHSLAGVYMALDIVNLFETSVNLTYKAPLFLLSSLFSVAALVAVFRYERIAANKHAAESTVRIDEDPEIQ